GSAPPPPPTAATAPAAAPSPAAPPAPPAPQSAPALAARGESAAVPWTQARIEADGNSVVVPRAQAGQLAALLARALQVPAETPAPTGPASLRLELAQGDEAVGSLELVGNRWRWTSLRESGPARGLRIDTPLGTAVREEAQRLLAR
ncbi:MAG TPA: hypothetical protein VLK85_18450, partial [Ramlibacter sp.]|nr:hypothetical protein [Ramlibacter sp.]